MGKFISGTVFAVISTAFCVFGTSLLLTAIGATDIGEALAGIILIPLALFSYLAQLIFGAIAEGLLWNNVACDGRAKGASVLIAVVCALAMVGSIVFFAYLMIFSGNPPATT